jgi:hypothetical protein
MWRLLPGRLLDGSPVAACAKAPVLVPVPGTALHKINADKIVEPLSLSWYWYRTVIYHSRSWIYTAVYYTTGLKHKDEEH